MSSIGIPEERLQTIRNRTEHHFQRDLYPWQIRAIKNILMRQRDTIVIAGTGSGKSLIFQSLQFATPDAIVLIVSPLVALMENQTLNLNKVIPKCSVALTAENVTTDPLLLKRAFNGEFRIVYATPEILFLKDSYFLRKVISDANHPFKKKLIAVALDECHCIKNWGKFRPYYKMTGTLRELLSDIPFIALSATLTPVGITEAKKGARLRDPLIVKESIRRYNLIQFYAPIRQPGFEDLSILIPKDIISAADIPQTLLFVDSRIQANAIAQWLRRKLPKILQSDECQIIRAYTGAVDSKAKSITTDGLNDESTRIVVCTEALGMGVHLENVVRVFQWKVDSDMGADTLTQRLGRGGRDFAKTALGVVFLSKANLSGKETTTPDHPDDPDEEHHTPKNVPKPIFSLPVTEENWATIEQFLPLMYHGPVLSKKGKKKVKNESVLVPAVKWAINTTGCRHRPFLAAFQDSKIFFDNPNPDCDNCMMKHLINTGDLNNPPTVLGIPLAITLAYLPYLPQNSAVPNKTLKTRGPPVNEERLNLLVADLQDWRQHITPTESYLHPTMILGNEAIEMIRKHIREITTEENLKEVLGKCGSRGRSGHRFPQSLLTPHLSGLFAAVLESIASSVHLQPKSRKSTVHRPKSALLRPATLPRPIPKPACLERFLPEIRIPMPSYRPVFNAAALSLPTASIAASRSPLADIQPNSLPRNSIGNVPNLLPHPPKSLGDKNEDTDDIVSIISTISRFTIKLPMKRIRENDPGWFEDYESRRTSRC